MMRRLHRIPAAGLGATLMLLAALGCAESSRDAQPAAGLKRLVLLNNNPSPFWAAARAGIDDANRELKLEAAGLRALMEDNDGTPQGQLDKLRQFASQSDIAGVGISALDASNTAVAEELRKLRAKGVHVVTFDADVDRAKFRDARSYYLGTDNRIGGSELGVAAKHLLAAAGKTGGSYVQFVGRTGSQNAIERMDGFKETLGAAYREADRMSDEGDRTRARENVRNAMRNHNDLAALVGIWSYNAPAIADVVKEQNAKAKYAVAVFDAEPIAITRLGEGLIDVMMVQDPYAMGYQSTRILKAMVENDQKTIQEMFPNAGKPDGDLFDTGLKVVVPDEKSPLKKEQFGARTQFLTLAEFKTWLEKYKLQGS
jgi:ribose transport system substrate-binding protein